MVGKIRSAALSIIILSLLVGSSSGAPGAAVPPAKPAPAPPMVYGVPLPIGATRIQDIAGSRSYKVSDEVRRVEKIYRTMFEASKDVVITARATGSAYIVIFEDRGQRPWSAIQISGVAGDKVCFFVVSKDTPTEIDPFP